jgi:signal peptidase II
MRVLVVSFFVIVFDQLSKLAVKGISIPFLGIDHPGMDYGQSIHVLGEWFNITFIENPNMAFSLDIAGKMFLSIFAAIASVILLIYLFKNREQPYAMRLALALILAGAVGNLIDRSLYGLIYNTAPMFEGNVVDFIDFNLFTINIGSGSFRFWPIFNIADMSVSIGVILLILGTRGAHKQASLAAETAGSPDTAIPGPTVDELHRD